MQTAAEKIKTFTEQVEDEALQRGIGDSIREADRIVFLGFGYHRQNIELLKSVGKKNVQILGTSLGMSRTDEEVVADELERVFSLDRHMVVGNRSWVRHFQLKCKDFLPEIWRTLTSSPGEDNTHEMPDASSVMPRTPPLPDFFGSQR